MHASAFQPYHCCRHRKWWRLTLSLRRPKRVASAPAVQTCHLDVDSFFGWLLQLPLIYVDYAVLKRQAVYGNAVAPGSSLHQPRPAQLTTIAGITQCKHNKLPSGILQTRGVPITLWPAIQASSWCTQPIYICSSANVLQVSACSVCCAQHLTDACMR